MIRLAPLALVLPLLPLAACAGAGPVERDRAEKLAYAPAGEAVSCVPIASIRETRVLDDRTIDVVLRGGGRLRSTLPFDCPGLHRNDGIAYSTSLSRLCDVDIFTVLDRIGGAPLPAASCGFGPFQPVRRVARRTGS